MLGAELKEIPALTAIPCGNPYINVGYIHKYPGLMAPIVCAKEIAATYKSSASGVPDVMTCSVVYRYRSQYRTKLENQKPQSSRTEAFIIVCVGAGGFRNKGGTSGAPRHNHKSENDVRLQGALGSQNPTGLPVGVVRMVPG